MHLWSCRDALLSTYSAEKYNNIQYTQISCQEKIRSFRSQGVQHFSGGGQVRCLDSPVLGAANGGGVTRAAPDEALLVKLGSPRERPYAPGDRWAKQSAAYASLDDDGPLKQHSRGGQGKVL